jgi:ABC-type glutathione transport system ATPase component
VAKNLSKAYALDPFASPRAASAISVLRNVSLTAGYGRTTGVVGESGAGKSTLARCLAFRDLPDSGEIRVDGQNMLHLRSSDLRSARRQIQLIVQHSAASLNPRLTALEVITEPDRIAGATTKGERRERGLAMMECIGLPRSAAGRNCSEFSGGERQRLAIGRALSVSPKVLILDEALSGLDLLIQAQLVNLLCDLQASRSMTYILISHDLRLTAHLADDLAVMQSGVIVEYGPAERVSRDPTHPHTRALLSAAARLTLPGRADRL